MGLVYGGDPWPVIVAAGVLMLTAGFLFALIMWWSMPPAGRAFTSPPVDAPGRTFDCCCFDRPVRVLVIDPTQVRITYRAKHARRSVRSWRRIHPAPPGHEGAGGTGKGKPPARVPTA
ncbi:hypothetical protein GCM10010319_24520 [Streptomyces blastmyceticus]|uniref:Uncharacterized protein n=1 Tax=Streptomyces blastmyceticus TaxID=68180 RepID=A0ABP3GMI9_9ACTN